MSVSLPKKMINGQASFQGPDRQNLQFQDFPLHDDTAAPVDMFKALALQSHHGRPLSDFLKIRTVDEATLLNTVAEESALPVICLHSNPPSPLLRGIVDPVVGIKHRFVCWKFAGKTLIIALSDPAQIDAVQNLLGDTAPNYRFVLAQNTAILGHYATHHRHDLSRAANRRVPAGMSARSWSGLRPRFIGAALLSSFAALATIAPQTLLLVLALWIFGALIANGLLKGVMMMTRMPLQPSPTVPIRNRLPKISILLPLLREEDIVDRLIERMSALVYPKDRLEICLVFEENDTATKNHLAACRLPYWMRKIEVPIDTLQTKPRAMNYALDFCNGDVIGIYDAEDAPEPDQLHKVARLLDQADETVACVQCQLDYYNCTTNWISRCFTLEYAILFRVMLPGLQRWNLPVPLGGTSVFFKRDILEKLGRWDAHNVTEDADLGIRLYRSGYRCLWSDATTYEEANFRILPWVRQRSRWLKGFLQTWITHMRHPIELLRQTGLAGFLVFQIQMIGTFTSFVAVPLVLPMWLYTFGVPLPVYDAVPKGLFLSLVAAFIATELLLLCLGALAVRRRNSPSLYLRLPTMLLYWPLGAFAAYKALWELFVHPNYWDKTSHGINDIEYQEEINRLTAQPGSAILQDSPAPISPASAFSRVSNAKDR
ncbi:glycosyltransferase family 2 protein [Neptunicoccus cionae]|uniref:glycosyltransferase family 2 protein n=1 Tax=Neptunicoccus cionae TaxID=2035344 RepID=UPI000C75703F|nr:glycosyltransferase family 2 protein [Amylibacter cionae]PLS20757.1 glycosyl transferase [Amylibacter cionae]